jgi:hypothetical protein
MATNSKVYEDKEVRTNTCIILVLVNKSNSVYTV